MREKQGFRDNLARLNEFFPEQELLNIQDLAGFTGKCRRTVKKMFQFSGKYISKVEVARQLSN